MKKASLHLLFGLLGLAGALPAWADVYAYKDAKGVMHFSNVPDDKRYQLVVATQRDDGVHAAAPSRAPTVDAGGKSRFGPMVEQTARAYQLDSALLHAVISAESGYNPKAVSRKGAAGLMQLMPDTAKRYGVANSFDPEQNVRGGAQYLRDLLHMFDNNLELAIAAYNAGEQSVQKYGNRVPPYPETMAYVPRVLKFYRKYQPAS